ncbi:uncharacterized protein G2W53_035151 [Senna tora]|uniref:Uncharacterized protein n=1 Tax=Senna tora TaxID=362788 RepID=A0A834SSC3_9FABA|nr:uncharacterized protein G2W53_035151 [Senna tora]
MVHEAFGFNRDVGIKANESIDEVESREHGEFKEITRRRLRNRTRSVATIQRTIHREFAS